MEGGLFVQRPPRTEWSGVCGLATGTHVTLARSVVCDTHVTHTHAALLAASRSCRRWIGQGGAGVAGMGHGSAFYFQRPLFSNC